MVNLDKYKNISYKKRESCVICGEPLNVPIINLPKFPLTEVYIDEAIQTSLGLVDQEFHYCQRCGHGQISNIIDPELLYGDSYKTRTSTSSSAIGSVEIFIDFINETIRDKSIDTLIEVGCNDLYTLKRFKDRAQKLYGIDPVLTDYLAIENNNIILIDDFIENVDFGFLNTRLDIVICSQTLEHIGNPIQTVKKLLDISNENTLLFFQFPSLEGLINDARFDQVFHQHLNYFSLKSIVHMLEKLDAELIDYKVNSYHWSSFMIAFRKKNIKSINGNKQYSKNIIAFNNEDIINQYKVFQKCIDVTNSRIQSLKNENIFGFGAALMLPVLDYHLKDGLSRLTFILDQDPGKIGKYYLNVPIKIVHPDNINNISDSIIVLTAINSLDAGRKIIPKLIEYNVKQILLPLNTL